MNARIAGWMVLTILLGACETPQHPDPILVEPAKVKVLGIRFFPVDPATKDSPDSEKLLDRSQFRNYTHHFYGACHDPILHWNAPCVHRVKLTEIRNLADRLQDELIDSYLNRASVYRHDDTAPADRRKGSIHYEVVETREFHERIPSIDVNAGSGSSPRWWVDYRRIMNSVDLCDYVDTQDVREVWLWAHNFGTQDDGTPVTGDESNMSMGLDVKAHWPQGSFGDVSNSYRFDDLPQCRKSYVVYDGALARQVGIMMHARGHQLESFAEFMEPRWWNDQFIGSTGNVRVIDSHDIIPPRQWYWRKHVEGFHPYVVQRMPTNGCGKIHFPPNVAFFETVGLPHPETYETVFGKISTDIELAVEEDPSATDPRWRFNPVSNDYQYDVSTPVDSYCSDLETESSARKLEPYSCRNWGCDADREYLRYYEWWYQRIPGRRINRPVVAGKKLRNFWGMYVDFDAFLLRGRSLHE